MHNNFKRLADRKMFLLPCSAGAIILFLLCALAAPAQTDQPGYYIKGEELFKQKRYYEAIQYFEKYLGTEIKSTPRSQPFAVKKKAPGKSNLNIHNEVVYRLAESYRLINNYTVAEKWYREAMSFSKSAYPACPYWYGVSLRANQKYEEAFNTITAFRESYTTMDELLVGADKELENLKFIREQLLKERDGFFVTRKAMPANAAAYALSASQPGNTVYTAMHEDKKNDLFVARLYEAAGEDAITGKEKMIPIDEAPGIHNGLATFSKEGKKMFFTRWMVNNGVTTSAIYSSDKTDTGWTKPVPLPEPVNMGGSNSAQPFITTDGKYLLFSSNRKGSIGKYDIWYAALDTNFNALLVTNAGNIVNTAGDETAPSYHQTSRTLLFSSNGHVGMGGYDIFSAKGDFQLSNWNKPVNAGKPINSSKDDLYFISTDDDNLWNTGWLSSDRATDCCLELFAVRQDNAQYVTGLITDCSSNQPLAGVTLTIKDPKQAGKVLLKQQTNRDGSYSFELKNSSRFEITAEKEGYYPANESYKVYFEAGTATVNNNNLCLSLVTQAATEQEGSGLSESATLAKFSFNQSSLGNTSSYELDSLAAFMHKFTSVVIEVGGYTDGKGSEAYNIKLAQKRVDACIRYLVKKGISKDRLVGKAYGECCPLEPEKINGKDNPAARQKNRRVEYRVVRSE
ncbi:OmpA family protein [Agriterribacter sp.]|uniref:OmpA family protein n=1 Tax=Agriterribacter sp. TaxID=2821509 RepID=UPI002B7483C2|nr:OmpA family protein [Agriterribacter sp.]HRO45526.1 OmpA family protein [Agriterribacter sp.]HRQ17952.1 OmpA family protein [Agriterribacter sp.]